MSQILYSYANERCVENEEGREARILDCQALNSRMGR